MDVCLRPEFCRVAAGPVRIALTLDGEIFVHYSADAIKALAESLITMAAAAELMNSTVNDNVTVQ
jgi:hypothetical protein